MKKTNHSIKRSYQRYITEEEMFVVSIFGRKHLNNKYILKKNDAKKFLNDINNQIKKLT